MDLRTAPMNLFSAFRIDAFGCSRCHGEDVPFLAVFNGFRVFFEVEAKAYDLPTSLRSEFWRKVRTQAGVYQILFRFPALLWPRNRRFIHFLSHKLGRLLIPFALLAMMVSSFGLAAPWRGIALAGQA